LQQAMTPRTTAFTQLNGGPGSVSVSNAGPARPLPFRDYHGAESVPHAR
jgi:hypothetical protein